MPGILGSAMEAIFGNASSGTPNAAAVKQGVADPNAVRSDNQNPGNAGATKVGQDDKGNLPTGEKAPKGDESPLAEYEDLFTIESKKPADSEPFTFDEKKFGEAVGGIDFTKGINPELTAKALGGDAQALSELLNGALRNSFKMSGSLTTRLVKEALTKQRDQLRSELPGSVSSHQTQQAMIAENPELNSPLLKPLLSTIETKLRDKFPEASDAEVQAHAKKVMTGMAERIVGKDKNNNSKDSKRTAAGSEPDWLEYAGVDLSQM